MCLALNEMQRADALELELELELGICSLTCRRLGVVGKQGRAVVIAVGRCGVN